MTLCIGGPLDGLNVRNGADSFSIKERQPLAEIDPGSLQPPFAMVDVTYYRQAIRLYLDDAGTIFYIFAKEGMSAIEVVIELREHIILRTGQ